MDIQTHVVLSLYLKARPFNNIFFSIDEVWRSMYLAPLVDFYKVKIREGWERALLHHLLCSKRKHSFVSLWVADLGSQDPTPHYICRHSSLGPWWHTHYCHLWQKHNISTSITPPAYLSIPFVSTPSLLQLLCCQTRAPLFNLLHFLSLIFPGEYRDGAKTEEGPSCYNAYLTIMGVSLILYMVCLPNVFMGTTLWWNRILKRLITDFEVLYKIMITSHHKVRI